MPWTMEPHEAMFPKSLSFKSFDLRKPSPLVFSFTVLSTLNVRNAELLGAVFGKCFGPDRFGPDHLGLGPLKEPLLTGCSDSSSSASRSTTSGSFCCSSGCSSGCSSCCSSCCSNSPTCEGMASGSNVSCSAASAEASSAANSSSSPTSSISTRSPDAVSAASCCISSSTPPLEARASIVASAGVRFLYLPLPSGDRCHSVSRCLRQAASASASEFSGNASSTG
mmetsp:Transcript_90828/g.180588  ORF Transcript_90828/g.180588 Transcript_90828/m.180588 type:complete len:224 (-) Transcript_90828:446-1117(-)